jgi:hypothetical protein
MYPSKTVHNCILYKNPLPKLWNSLHLYGQRNMSNLFKCFISLSVVIVWYKGNKAMNRRRDCRIWLKCHFETAWLYVWHSGDYWGPWARWCIMPMYYTLWLFLLGVQRRHTNQGTMERQSNKGGTRAPDDQQWHTVHRRTESNYKNRGQVEPSEKYL